MNCFKKQQKKRKITIKLYRYLFDIRHTSIRPRRQRCIPTFKSNVYMLYDLGINSMKMWKKKILGENKENVMDIEKKTQSALFCLKLSCYFF